jgi:hypothetical protein
MTRNFGFRQLQFRHCRFRSLAAAVVALIALSPMASAWAQKNITVLANYTFHGRHAPFFVAVEKGYFTEAGFKADVQPATGSGFVISASKAARPTTASPTRARPCRRSPKARRSRASRSTWTSRPTVSLR